MSDILEFLNSEDNTKEFNKESLEEILRILEKHMVTDYTITNNTLTFVAFKYKHTIVNNFGLYKFCEIWRNLEKTILRLVGFFEEGRMIETGKIPWWEAGHKIGVDLAGSESDRSALTIWGQEPVIRSNK